MFIKCERCNEHAFGYYYEYDPILGNVQVFVCTEHAGDKHIWYIALEFDLPEDDSSPT